MMQALHSDLLLVGVGPMARSYADVLKKLGVEFTAVGRDPARAAAFAAETDASAIGGGLAAWLRKNPAPRRAIVAIGADALAEGVCLLLKAGCRSILLEKPGALDRADIHRVDAIAREYNAFVQIAFNRRYYASVAAVREMIAEDGGVSSAYFDFTELAYRVADLPTSVEIKQRWFYANSLHVVDLAFHLIGAPHCLESTTNGALSWHASASHFAGFGVSEHDVPFSYRADWNAPGRWRVEMFTRKRRLVLCPLEMVRVQTLGSFEEKQMELDDRLDVSFKPGLFRQVQAWLGGDTRLACTIEDAAAQFALYERMGGYNTQPTRRTSDLR